MDALHLRIADDLTLAVPASLDSLTTYVLLEQEAWFEKEIAFVRRWLRPGMTAIDIGANLGVYSLLMAKCVAPGGRVFAFEPASQPRALLEESRRLNNAGNLEIVAAALSDAVREGHLVFGVSSELNALGEGGAGERVRITSLDTEDAARGWSPDFIKIDAEGEEERILAGGRAFFARHSPLMMFEIKAGATVNEQLRAGVAALGYRLFRQLAGAPILVPTTVHEPLDAYELNLFAAKDDRIASLAAEGVLVDAVPPWQPEDLAAALPLLRQQAFAADFAQLLGDDKPLDPAYGAALAAYAVWRDAARPLASRCAALAFAYERLRELCTQAQTYERLSTFARVAWEWGMRHDSVNVVRHMSEMLARAPLQLREPFWPASPRYDDVSPGGQHGLWFVVATADLFERGASYSSLFAPPSPALAFLNSQPLAGAEMERRRVLTAARAGERPQVPPRLRAPAADHLNADVWAAGKVPGTVV